MNTLINLNDEQIDDIDCRLEQYDRSFIGYRLPGSVNIGIESGGKLVAGLNGYMSAFKILYIGTVFVEKDFRKRGLGTQLMQEAERRAKELGANMIRLDTFNWQGRGFYERLGYEEVGRYESADDGFSEHFFLKRI